MSAEARARGESLLQSLIGCALVALAGCGTSPPSSAPSTGLVVEAWSGKAIALQLDGTVVHPHPLPYTLTRAWIPLKTVADEGSRIVAGAAVAELDGETVMRWASNDRLQLIEQIAQNGQDRLRNEQRLADLSRSRDELLATMAVIDAEIAALAVRDSDRIAIARRELDDARRAAARATQTLERTRALHRAGFASAAAVAAAENDAALKGAATAVPDYTLLILEHGSTSLTRRQKQLERARQAAQLDGITAQIAALRQSASNGERNASRDLVRVQQQVAQWDSILADPVVHAAVDGIVMLKDASIRAGAKPSQSPFAYLLDDIGMVAEVLVSDRLRDFVAVGAMVSAHVDALGVTIPARVSGVAAAPEPMADGSGRAFRCRIAFVRPEPGLRPGMAVRCDITVDLAGRAPLAVIPSWALSDRRHPAVLVADGDRRELDAAVVGRDAVIFAGLAPGDKIIVGDAPRTGTIRISSTLDPARFLPLRVSSNQRWDGGWELVEMLADGATVKAGEVVAKLAKVGWGDVNDFRIDAEVAELAAAARLTQARADAAASLADALAGWRAATQSADRARLDLYIALLDGSDSKQISTAAAVVRAEVAQRKAQTAATELAAPGAASAYSADDAARRATDLARATLALRGNRLEEAVARRYIDLLTITAARSAVLDSEGDLDNRRGDYLIARLQGQQQIAAAQLAWRDEYNRQKGNREQAAGETLRAPRDGQVFHRPDQNGRPVRLGDQISGREAFIMPIDDRRTMEVEIPARFYGRFAVGTTVAVVVPALGGASREATVVAVAAYFADPTGVREERASHGSVGVPERIFRLTLGLDLSPVEAQRAPPGSTAYVDL